RGGSAGQRARPADRATRPRDGQGRPPGSPRRVGSTGPRPHREPAAVPGVLGAAPAQGSQGQRSQVPARRTRQRSVRFWDSSAVVPLCVAEPNSARTRSLLEEDPAVAVWWGTRTECLAALVRRLRDGEIAPAGHRAARRVLNVLAEA